MRLILYTDFKPAFPFEACDYDSLCFFDFRFRLAAFRIFDDVISL
jgi:hypothetical protein